MMKTNRLGRTDLMLSAVGLGGWCFGGGYDWGPVDTASAERAVNEALSRGINWVDTAPVYGESEQFLGRVLAARRCKIFYATKCGLIKRTSWPEHDLSAQTIVCQVENSLKNLRTDYIDLYQVHYPDPKTPWEEVFACLARLRTQGKIRYVGVCNVSADELRQILSVFPDLAGVQNEYSLLHPARGKEVFELCQKQGVGFIGYGSLCGGILSGKYKKEPNFRRADARNYFYKCYRGESFARAQKVVSRVRIVAQNLGVTPAQTALAWALSAPEVTSALCGMRTPEQVRDNAGAAGILLPAQTRRFLEGNLCV